MQILNGFEDTSIQKALELLRSGDVVVFPTETVYGLGADTLNPYAVARIFEIKKRPKFDPLIIHIGEKDWIFQFADDIPSEIIKLVEKFWPGPLTVILQKKKIVPDIVTAGLSTVGIRMPSHPVALNLIRALKNPIAAPSANPFGYISPTKAIHVASMFRDAVPLILDGGDCDFGIESTIVSVQDGKTFIHRHGAVGIEELSGVAGKVYEKRKKAHGKVYESPGEFPYHYAPHRPLRIVDSQDEVTVPSSSFLAFKKPEKVPVSKHLRILSHTGDIKEAATRFFSYLIELDSEDVDIIYAEKIPEDGLGKAMMERLRKASKNINR